MFETKVMNQQLATPPKADFAKSLSLSAPDFDSQWQPDNASTTHVFSLKHNLNKTVRIVQVYFSPGGDDSSIFPIQWSWYGGIAANPVTIEVTTQQVRLHIAAGYPLHGVYDAQDGVWRAYATGYWRALCWV